MTAVIVYTTFSNTTEARRVAEDLVERHLAACCNIFPGMISIFEWGSEFGNGEEVAMMIKTTEDRVQKIYDHIGANHSYEVPALVHWRIDGGEPKYMEWIRRHSMS